MTGRASRIDLDAGAGKVVQASTADLQRRHHRRHLLDVAEQVRRDDAAHDVGVELVGEAAHVVHGHHRAVGVERRCLGAEHHVAGVRLAALGHEPQQAGDVADADNEHAGGAGVERAGVADAPLTEPAAQHADHVVAGDTGRLVDHDETVDARRPAPGHQPSP